LEWIGGGGQDWRAVSLVFRPDAVYWGSDDPDGASAVFRYDRDDGHLHRVGPVSGPVYYSLSLGSKMLFATSVEKRSDPHDRVARIFQLDESGELSEVMGLAKDLLPAQFGYGVLEFAHGSPDGDLIWLTPKGLRARRGSYLCRPTDA
jgi:hypothetical protein